LVIDPVGLGEEVVGFGVVFGIKDSTAAGGFRRDSFEFLVYNTSNQLLGGVQFDNATLDTVTGLPGVKSVTNQIEVKESPPASSDTWLYLKVKSAPSWHPVSWAWTCTRCAKAWRRPV
jgi:hypothetical protein